MKIYVHDKGVILSGKAWEIVQKLKEYGKNHQLVSDWVENNKQNHTSRPYNKPVINIERER